MAGLLMWRAQAACLDVDPRIFHDKTTVAEAIAVCNTCDWWVECAFLRQQVEFQVGAPAVGVWGGVLWLKDGSSLKAKAGSVV
jgi:hypothetical protein